MNKLLKMIVVGALVLGSSALWALGSHTAWSVERLFAAAAALAVIGFALYL